MPKLRSVPPCRPATPRELRELAARRRFRALRIALFRTQLAAAVFLDVDDSTVERWECGATKVPLWAFLAIEQLSDARFTCGKVTGINRASAEPAGSAEDKAVRIGSASPAKRRAA
jgi:hypothetical protein